MQQLSLFDDNTPAIVSNAKSLARTEHPSTSHEAAEQIIKSLSELHRWCVECVTESPGCTAKELAAKYSPEDERKLGRRLNECESAGLIKRGGTAVCSVTHHRATVWFPK